MNLPFSRQWKRNGLKLIPKLSRNLAATAQEANLKTLSAKRLNLLAEKLGGGVDYLEVGVEKGETFEGITATRRVGVDPNPLFNDKLLPFGVEFWRTTSDKFFSKYPGDDFDLIFLDGLHEAKQTYLDIINAFSRLRNPGFVLVDDVWPTDFASSIGDRERSERQKKRDGISHRRWYGDVYKAIGLVSLSHPEVSIQIIGDGAETHAQALLSRVGPSSAIRPVPHYSHELERFCFEELLVGEVSEPWRSAVTDQDFASSTGLDA